MIKTQTSSENLDATPFLVWVKLLCCSFFGIGFFLVPFTYDGSWTIVLGVASGAVSGWLGDNMKYFTCSIFIVGALISVIYNLTPHSFAIRLPLSRRLMASHWSWTLLTLIGGITAAMTLFQVGPNWIIGKDTGITAYIDVAGAIFLLIGLGCLFLPFLTDYGLLDFIGTLLQRTFQRVFNLPGRATIDTLASWVGSSSIAVVMTNYQYQQGYYSARESAVIATNFSVVSIPFVLLTSQVAGIEQFFLPLYGTMFGICILCAIITPRLPPLASFKDEYYQGQEKQLNEDVEQGESRLSCALQRAVSTAKKAPSPAQSMKKGFWSMFDIYLMMMPAAMAIEFLTLAVYYNTSIMQTLAYPLFLLLDALQVPQASMAAPGMFIGLLDQFVPTIIAGSIDSPFTKFILAGLSITQLIFFAETAILIMRSAIPLTIMQLIAIFAIRTLIAFPILYGMAHLLF